jgi:hypothetical protein
LQKQTTDALAARRDSLRQAFFQALGQVESQALARAGFNQSADQFQQTMAYNQQQAAQAQANANRSFAEQQREYNLSRKDARLAAAAAGGKAGASSSTPWTAYGMTPTQWRSATTDAIGQANKAANAGVPVQQFMDELTRVGNVPPEVTLEAVRRIYGALKPVNPHVHPKLEAAYQSYRQWLSDYYAQTGGTTPSQTAGRHR